MPIRSHQDGTALLEALAALLIVSLGLFSVISIHMRTLRDAQAGIRRSQAIRLIEDLGERIRANPRASEHVSIYTSEAVPGSADACLSLPCTTAQLAQSDTAQWHEAVDSTPGMGKALVFAVDDAAPHGTRQIGVLIAWKSDVLPSGEDRFEAAQEHACPSDHACYLQTISLPPPCPAGACR